MRLLVHVEGQTEEVFVNEALAPYLFDRGYTSVSARLLGNSRLRARRGGIASWNVVRSDIANHLKQDSGALATTIVDYYALPAGTNGWPGRDASSALALSEKASLIESAVSADLGAFMGAEFSLGRFVPYIAMHEFEGLLFSDCAGFADGLGKPALRSHLEEVRNAFESPEHINDSPLTAPSKRVLAIDPTYQKTLHGPLAALYIGIDAIRAQCPGFERWIARLEAATA